MADLVELLQAGSLIALIVWLFFEGKLREAGSKTRGQQRLITAERNEVMPQSLYVVTS